MLKARRYLAPNGHEFWVDTDGARWTTWTRVTPEDVKLAKQYRAEGDPVLLLPECKCGDSVPARVVMSLYDLPLAQRPEIYADMEAAQAELDQAARKYGYPEKYRW